MSSIQNAQNAPAMRPPPGVQPNFVNPPSYKDTIIVLEGVFLTLTVLAVAMRIYVRAKITKVWGWDDYSCIIAACGSLAHMIVYTQMFHVGFGRHLWDIRAVTLMDIDNTRLLSANGIVYPLTIFFAKLSILLLYLRIFNVQRRLRWAIWVGIIFQALYYTAILGVAAGSISICNGPSQLTNQFCINWAKPMVILNSAVNVATDFYVLVLPIHSVTKLQLSFKRRLGLLLVFAGGIATCGASLTRMVISCQNYGQSDILWIQGNIAQYTIVEINVAIIVACASCIPAFFAKTKVAGFDAYHFIRSRLTSRSRLSKSGSSHDVASKQHVDSDAWYGDRTKLKESYTELRDVNFADTDVPVPPVPKRVGHTRPLNV